MGPWVGSDVSEQQLHGKSLLSSFFLRKGEHKFSPRCPELVLLTHCRHFPSDPAAPLSRPGTCGTGVCWGCPGRAEGGCSEGAGSHHLLTPPGTAVSTGSLLPCVCYTPTFAAAEPQLPTAVWHGHGVPEKSPCKEAKGEGGEGNGDAQRKHSVSGLMARSRRLWSCSRSPSEHASLRQQE